MRPRPTARVLLLDGEGRILMMRARVRADDPRPARWFTVGGGVEDGEELLVAALREATEETGFDDIVVERLVWWRDRPGRLHTGEDVLFQERYVLARCAGGPISREAWEAHEHDLVDDVRWWSLDDLRRTDEMILPTVLGRMLEDLLAGRAPEAPVELDDPD